MGNLINEKQQILSKYEQLREKFDRTIKLELVQRQQWDTFLRDLDPS
jgi:cyclopropane fatty-acyl-phospholipid synthase-like methyltransferase